MKNFKCLFLAVLIAFFVASSVAVAAPASLVRLEKVDDVVTMTPSNGPNLRFPGNTGIYRLQVHPAIVGQKAYAPDNYMYFLGNGITQQINVTLNAATRAAYNDIGADGYFVQLDMNLYDATYYEVILNDELVDSGPCAGMKRGIVRFMLYNEIDTLWKVILYDNTNQGKPLFGYIYYK